MVLTIKLYPNAVKIILTPFRSMVFKHRSDRTTPRSPEETNWGAPIKKGPKLKGLCVMSISKLIAFERFFDRSAVVFLLVLGAAAGATAFVGA